MVERKPGKTIVNVDALLSNAGSNALEVLEQSPGVKVDNDIISLKGKQGVTVFIDGKPAYLQGSELANYLKSLPASILDKIEIMPNPLAGFDAAGNGGVINITLKKGKNQGFNGNVSSDNTQGRYTRVSQSANLNYRSSRLNLYGNFYNYNGAAFSDFSSERHYTDRSRFTNQLQQNDVRPDTGEGGRRLHADAQNHDRRRRHLQLFPPRRRRAAGNAAVVLNHRLRIRSFRQTTSLRATITTPSPIFT